MNNIKNVKQIEVNEWDELVSSTYNKPYSFQQQEGCKSRGAFQLTIPSDYIEDEKMHDSIPEEINGKIMGVKFNKWLERDSKQKVDNSTQQWEIKIFWHRNFYPDVYTIANNLYKKGLIEKGNYIINIDW